jgi:hypothetical protein
MDQLQRSKLIDDQQVAGWAAGNDLISPIQHGMVKVPLAESEVSGGTPVGGGKQTRLPGTGCLSQDASLLIALKNRGAE